MSAAGESAAARAAAAWGDDLPGWVAALAAACDRAPSQAEVARRIGYSPAVVSTVIKATYRGDFTRVEAAVRAHLMGDTVACPVLGALALAVCRRHAAAPFPASSPIAARVWQACQTCPHNRGGRNR